MLLKFINNLSQQRLAGFFSIRTTEVEVRQQIQFLKEVAYKNKNGIASKSTLRVTLQTDFWGELNITTRVYLSVILTFSRLVVL